MTPPCPASRSTSAWYGPHHFSSAGSPAPPAVGMVGSLLTDAVFHACVCWCCAQVHVAQHADVASNAPVLEHVVASDEEKAYLDSEVERLLALLEDDDGEDESFDPDRVNAELERNQQRLEDIDARRAETRASAIL